ncbi:Ig-like domain-containing protein [Ruminococcus albus]|uniref:Ig domain protein group 2 domain protein n=1 Tax=Ruminococcus albus (strain ATCC 27210 / DSM 20455 / JCM 14654 / NCDO 2250 / 7) TaxID=697329 RepID=E6UGP8_RUMA7|nr:Ig-like domain-containing protein [Ruminococcus albus]ADU23710.1 Ig domain protein group 2 domain protein [Ruminococcus albus 7 = DSM 20455]
METKKSNIIYTLFILITIPLFFFMLSYPALRSKANDNKSKYYNESIELGAYMIKVSDAAYLEDKSELDFMLSVIKKSGKTEEVKPEIESVYYYYKGGKYKDVTSNMTIDQLSDISSLAKISDAESEFSYIGIAVSYKENDHYADDKVDEFGDTIKGELIEGKTYKVVICIDKRDIEFMDSKDYDPKGKDLSSQESDDTSSEYDDDSSKPEYTSITTTTTKPMLVPDSRQITTTSRISESSSSSSKKDNSSSAASHNNSVGNGNVGGYSGGYSGGGYSGGGNNYNDYEEPPREEGTTTTKQVTTSVTTTATTPQPTVTTTPAPVTRAIIHVDGIKLETDYAANNVTLKIGEKHKIKAVISPDNADDKSVKWESNREDIAVIDANGEIKAVGKGKAIITATTNDGGLKASCMVTVS